MLRYFDEIRKRPARALQIWLLLRGRTANRQTTTYQMLSKVLGFQGERVFADIFGYIAFYCDQNGLPPLTALAVKKDTGLPGEGPGCGQASRNRSI